MRILFQTNLDEAQRDVHALNSHVDNCSQISVPQIGSKVRFQVPDEKHYDLEVVDVTLDHEVTDFPYQSTGPTYLVELHLGSAWAGQSINAWIAHMERLRKGIPLWTRQQR